MIKISCVFFRSKTESTIRNPTEPGPFGDFYLQELVNSGGMADIWLASDKDQNTYALRRLHDRLKSDSTAKARFLQGCDILAKLPPHECVVGYYGHGKADGALYLLMEFIEGANLKLMYGSQEQVWMDNVANIIIDMARGLEHVHESGFIHLDFKPENVLVTRNGSVRLADFDLAQPMPKQPKKLSKNPGTPAYMSPEQLAGEPIDQRADIFAFGVSAYELLTGHKPFAGETATEILGKQKNRAALVAPRDHNPDLPINLEKVILKCLQFEPDKRYLFMSVAVHELKLALYV